MFFKTCFVLSLRSIFEVDSFNHVCGIMKLFEYSDGL